MALDRDLGAEKVAVREVDRACDRSSLTAAGKALEGLQVVFGYHEAAFAPLVPVPGVENPPVKFT